MSDATIEPLLTEMGALLTRARTFVPGPADFIEQAALSRTVRRVRDIAGSVLLLALTLPLLLIVAAMIKLDSPGPVLYRQDRVGLNGKIFKLLKLRSMRTDAEAAGPCWAVEHDPRVTRFGAVLRARRIDELPQLINVLRGDMSLVGPRPERPCFTAQLTQVIPRYDERIRVLPGLTGWAQVRYRYGASIEDAREKLHYDLYYVAHRGLLFDLRILLTTVGVVLRRSGAR